MNKAILMGRLVKEPEIRATNSGMTVANFTIAVDRRVKQGEERQADFINIVAFSYTADFVKNYFTKGMRVAVVGRIQTRNWDDAEGKRHYVTEIVADEVHFADGKGSNGETYQPRNNPTPPPSMGSGDGVEFTESDDIPF